VRIQSIDEEIHVEIVTRKKGKKKRTQKRSEEGKISRGKEIKKMERENKRTSLKRNERKK